MKTSRVVLLTLALFAPYASVAQPRSAAERAWKPFFAAFRDAVRKRDRAALRSMLVSDFFTSGGVGDDNGDGDSRDETFAFWDEPETRGWEALQRVSAQGVVPHTASPDSRRAVPSKIAPPIANSRKASERESFDWYAIFEFRDGRWYCVIFAQCCD